MTKYDEYKLKAAQLDKLLSVLGKDHITVETVTLGGATYRVTNDRSDKSKSIIVRVTA